MRGKLGNAWNAVVNIGLIPAHAGKTIMEQTADAHGKAHPRACGENGRGRMRRCQGSGSSPRMRGKHCATGAAAGEVGLIPAHAGKTRGKPRRHSTCQAHPRACGENIYPSLKTCTAKGSSPRMRGKRVDKLISGLSGGLIPAHAGKTDAGIK